MSQKIKLDRKGFEAKAYKNSIDTSFKQLVPPPPPVEETITIEDFFELYKTLFYEIPADGEINSHKFIIERSTEYTGFTEEKDQDIQILLDEITSLREELLTTQKELREIQTNNSLPTIEESNIETGTQVTAQPFNVGTSNVN